MGQGANDSILVMEGLWPSKGHEKPKGTDYKATDYAL